VERPLFHFRKGKHHPSDGVKADVPSRPLVQTWSTVGVMTDKRALL
jgi:hypothetical protein